MTRRRIQAREPFTVDDPRTFHHTDAADCPCKPRTIVVNPSGLRMTVLLHYPATKRGQTKNRGTGLPKGWVIQGRGRAPGMTEGQRKNEDKKINPRRGQR